MTVAQMSLVLTTDHNHSIQTRASTRAMQTSPLGFFFLDQPSTSTAFIGKDKNKPPDVKNILFDVEKSKEGQFSLNLNLPQSQKSRRVYPSFCQKGKISCQSVKY